MRTSLRPIKYWFQQLQSILVNFMVALKTVITYFKNHLHYSDTDLTKCMVSFLKSLTSYHTSMRHTVISHTSITIN